MSRSPLQLVTSATRNQRVCMLTSKRFASTSTTQRQRRPLQPFLLERFDGWKDSTMSLSSSECEPLTLKELLAFADDEGRQRWESLSLGYVEPSNGSAYLRQEIIKAQVIGRSSSQTSLDLDPSHCVNVCAPQEGIFLGIQALCQPGDHIVCVAPAYQSLHEVAASLGCDVTLWWPEEVEIKEATSFQQTTSQKFKTMRFNPSTLKNMMRPGQTKMVIANFPHNPSGALPSQQDFQSMIDIVQDQGAWFLVDEMYQGLEHAGEDHRLASVATCMPKGISLGGVSKSYGLPGLRIGWLLNQDTSFHERVSELKDYTTICPPAPSEALAFIALRARDALWRRSRGIVAYCLPKLRDFITKTTLTFPLHTFEWCEPQGGTFAWVKFSSTSGVSASEYCQAVQRRKSLMMVPAGLFPECLPYDDRIRLTYGKKGTEDLLKVLEDDLRQELLE
jgi:aspartate/methionine/tyrosine aminotransferase